MPCSRSHSMIFGLASSVVKARPLRHVIGEAAVVVNWHDGVDAELHANL